MDKTDYHARIETPVMLDYGVYLQVDRLLTCQKPLAEMVNGDELQFQIVHQVEELWMKLIAYTLVDVLDYMEKQDTHRVVTLMGRVHRLMRLMTAQLSAVYLWSAIDKCEPGFLGGARIEQIAGFYYFGSDLPLGTALTIASATAAVVVVALELGLAIGVWRPRWHRRLLPLGVAFHAGLYVLLPVATFSATMVLLYLAAIEPAAVHRAVARLAPGADE